MNRVRVLYVFDEPPFPITFDGDCSGSGEIRYDKYQFVLPDKDDSGLETKLMEHLRSHFSEDAQSELSVKVNNHLGGGALVQAFQHRGKFVLLQTRTD